MYNNINYNILYIIFFKKATCVDNKYIIILYLGLSKDLLNSPYHVLGQHSKCDTYFCNKKNLDEDIWIKLAENSGMMTEINNIVNRLVINSSSLIVDVDNNICEQFNSLINKYIGGKRINLSQRNTYNTRIEAAVVAFNSKQYLRAINTHITKKSPGTTKLIVIYDLMFLKKYFFRSRHIWKSVFKKRPEKTKK